MFAVLEALPLLSLVVAPENQEASNIVEDSDPDERVITPELTQALVALWNDPAIRSAMGESRFVLQRQNQSGGRDKEGKLTSSHFRRGQDSIPNQRFSRVLL